VTETARSTPDAVPAPSESNLLYEYLSQGRLADAERVGRQLVQRFPDDARLWSALARTLEALDRIAEALACFQRAADLSPDDAVLAFNLAKVHGQLGHHEMARRFYSRALQLRPDFVEACNNLGATLNALGQREHALLLFRRAIALQPENASAHSNLGLTLQMLGRLDEAHASHRRAVAVAPHVAQIHNNLALVLAKLGRREEAIDCYRQALELDPQLFEARIGMSTVLSLLGRFDEAEQQLRHALHSAPDHVAARSNLLMCLNYLPYPVGVCIEEARLYGKVVDAKAARVFSDWQLPESAQCLRVGIVSGDLREHPVGYFLESVLAEIDPARIELHAYTSHPAVDGLSERLRLHFRTWKSLVGLSDEAAARMIHADGINILIDLSGHTSDNRLPVFAGRPAPVQVSWLGYFATTGVVQIDWLIADPWAVPPEHECHFTERIWRLPETRMCFSPPRASVPVSDLPALEARRVTYCCFNNLNKMNDEVVAVWSRILRGVPGSRLMLKAKQLEEASVREVVTRRFATHGIDAGRLVLQGRSPRALYLAAYQSADIALDPFPFTGATTTAESLWMGVPVITLRGDRLVSRQGLGMMANAGLPEWIADDLDDYVHRAIYHARDLQKLAALRRGLRDRVLSSPIYDSGRFAKNLTCALFGMWECRTRAHDSARA
jgi:predicted O-linked N-acetylglucosamine transferase (SPINDLY family)